MQMEFEALAERLANASTVDELRAAAGALLHGQAASTATVFIARDTRPSGGSFPSLCRLCRATWFAGLSLVPHQSTP